MNNGHIFATTSIYGISQPNLPVIYQYLSFLVITFSIEDFSLCHETVPYFTLEIWYTYNYKLKYVLITLLVLHNGWSTHFLCECNSNKEPKNGFQFRLCYI